MYRQGFNSRELLNLCQFKLQRSYLESLVVLPTRDLVYCKAGGSRTQDRMVVGGENGPLVKFSKK